MHTSIILLIAFFGIPAVVQQQDTTATEGPWPSYGYIALGAIVLTIIVVVLIKKQHRKFNE